MPAQGFTIKVGADIDGFMRSIDEAERDQIPFVTAYALTQTAKDVQAAEVDAMSKVFDRPTRFTLNSLYVKPATKREQTAFVLFKEGFGSIPAWRYLGPEVEGGRRGHKGFELALIRAGVMRSQEFAVPGSGAPLDQYGNIPGGQITRILSQLFATPDAQQWATKSRRSIRGRQRGGSYFAIRDQAGIPNGVYKRGGGRSVIPVLMFVRQPRYRKRLPFYQIATEVMQRRFAYHFRSGWDRYVVPRRLAA